MSRMCFTETKHLPVHDVLSILRQTLAAHNRCILEAPPGAGKTTLVPPSLLEEDWLQKKGIFMLEPRRMAVRNAAAYMAASFGEVVGDTVGYAVRLESRTSRKTRITVVTEGILTRLVQEDPELNRIGCLIFDEFHERNLDADLGLALALDCQQALRPDLRILIMSATLNTEPLARLLSDEKDKCPVISCQGRVWPVVTRYLPPDRSHSGLETRIADAVRMALKEEEGGILVFLPGAPEIRRVQRFLKDTMKEAIPVYPLYGDLPFAEQQAALAENPSRKIILATSIAETSLTIPGIRIVIDSGLRRHIRFDPGKGMSRLITERVSLAGAEQRRGRAARTGPGICYRLWHQGEETGMSRHHRPEILDADLAPLCLELAVWGVREPETLLWLDVPPLEAFIRARELLQSLEALDDKGNVTLRGRQLVRLPLHPRSGHMLLEAQRQGSLMTACLLAVLIEERDPCPDQGVDIRPRLALVAKASHNARETVSYHRIWELAKKLFRSLTSLFPSMSPNGEPILIEEEQAAVLLALAYPERIAMKRERGSFRMANGRGAFIPGEDPLADQTFLAIGAVSAGQGNARIYQAAPLTHAQIENLFASRILVRNSVHWDTEDEAVIARKQRCLGALVLEEAPLEHIPADQALTAILQGIRHLGLECLPWTAPLRQWRQRVLFMKYIDHYFIQKGVFLWPDTSDEGLLNILDSWLGPFLSGITRRSQFRQLSLEAALEALLSPEARYRLHNEAPTHITVPSGSRIALDYGNMHSWGTSLPGNTVPAPVLAVKLQEMFGLLETPRVGGGKVPVIVHLLSPAGRPLQITRDLAGFWKNGYLSVRAEMRGRYPKHPWPEDPLNAPPTRHVRKR